MVKQAPDVSVVVPTYRRPGSLSRALAGIAAQRAPFSWDVVVVDNDPGRSAADVVRRAAADTLDVCYVTESRVGAAHARNRGLAASEGRVVALLDDDVVPQPGWLATVCAPVREKVAVAAGGPVVLDPAVPRPRWLDEQGLGGYLTAFSLGAESRSVAEGEMLLTANMAVARSALDEVGGFDATFGPRGTKHLVADDVRLVRQLQSAGGRLDYVSDAVVVHELPAARLRRRYLLRRAWLQGRSDWQLDRLDHAARRAGGLRVAATLSTGWLVRELGQRWREGLAHPATRLHLGCDLARWAGTWREALAGVRSAR